MVAAIFGVRRALAALARRVATLLPLCPPPWPFSLSVNVSPLHTTDPTSTLQSHDLTTRQCKHGRGNVAPRRVKAARARRTPNYGESSPHSKLRREFATSQRGRLPMIPPPRRGALRSQSAIRNPPRRGALRSQSAIRNPQSAIPNPQSQIPSPPRRGDLRSQSTIRNPQSAIHNPFRGRMCVWNLLLEIWSLFEIWCLGFGACLAVAVRRGGLLPIHTRRGYCYYYHRAPAESRRRLRGPADTGTYRGGPCNPATPPSGRSES